MRRRTLTALCLAAAASTPLVLTGPALPAAALPVPVPLPIASPTASASAIPTAAPSGSSSPTAAATSSPSGSATASPTAGTDDEDTAGGEEIPLTASPDRGGPGTAVTLTAPCSADDGTAFFVPADAEGEQDVVPIDDVSVEGGTLTARFTIPAGAAPGDAGFVVGCGEEQFGIADFRVLTASGEDPGGSSADGDALADAVDQAGGGGGADAVAGDPTFTG